MKILKLFYKPFAIIAGLIGARVGRSVFRSLWAKLDDAAPPPTTAGYASLGKVVGAAALEAATVAATGAVAAQVSAKSFEHLVGVWPGETEREPAED